MPSSDISARAAPGRRPAADGFWQRHGGIVVVLLLFLGLGGYYSMMVPIFEASDELWHYPFVKRLADGGGLPVQRAGQIGPWRQEGSQPPLYYALGALLTRGIDTSDMGVVRWINPHADIGIPTRDRNVNMVVHTERERFPFRGSVLAVHLVRWLSVLMGAGTVLAGYLLALEVCSRDRLVALTAASLTAFNAMFLFVTSSVNNDALAVMLCSLCLWLMARYLGGQPGPARWVLLGVLLGLASISKASALAMAPLVALTVSYVAWRRRAWGVGAYCYTPLLVGLPVLLLGGWWYYRNWRLYGDPSGLNAFVAIVGGRYPVPSLRQLAGEWKGFVMSYWGFFGGMNVPAPSWVYWALSALGLVGIVGSPLYVWRRHVERPLASSDWARIVLVAVWPPIVFVSLVRWTLMTIASQGRLMFVALTAINVLMAMGLAGVFPRRHRRIVPGVAGLVSLGVAMLMPLVAIRPAYARPARLSETEVARLVTRLDVTFGGAMRLLGYRLENDRALPGGDLAVTLYWQALAPMRENYSVFVHLLAANDLIIGQRDMYPGQGNYPTTLWSPGEIVADTYVLAVSPTAMTPGEAQVEAGLYRLETGVRLQAVDSAGKALGDNVRFGHISLPLRSVGGIPNPVEIILEDQVALVGYALDRTAARPGELLQLTLYWRALRNLDTNYSVFTHVLGEQNRLWAQKDGWPQGGNAPTATWRKGQLVEDRYALVIARDAPAGVYELEVGMYRADGKRLSILGRGGHVQDTRIVLSKVRVLAAGQP